MSNDNKTLADAQPGGRVRLGDQAERARFEAWHCEKFKTRWQTGAPTRDMHNGVYADNYGPAEEQVRWEAWQAALSARPSPDGQDALPRFRCAGYDCSDEGSEENTGGPIMVSDPSGEWVRASDALAARQPVECETIAEVKAKLTPREWSIMLAAVGDALAARQPVGRSFQAGVAEWMGQCFLPSLYSNMTERGDRLLEEVLELLQAHGYDSARVPTLVDYVFGRPVGEPAQEVGGVMVTLAGYCWVAALDMHVAGDAELARISQPEVMAKIRAKQEAKNALHFDTPLPGNAGPTAQAVDLERFRGTVKSQYSMTEWMHRCGFVSAEKLEDSKKNHDHLLALIDSQAVGK
ncbi:hypothetical protein [Stenotrophomonas forensis]|uniref:hypothetical protein n=1 Tax=Stenotrophomonas forensis TaxID=2871169 RepID=UPI0039C744DF